MSFFKNQNKDYYRELLLNNQLLLKELECVACNKYMKEPIHQCIKGHSLCVSCAAKSDCFRCHGATSNIRNLHLENVALKVKYPCKNLEAGCRMLFSHSHLSQHEEGCSLGVFRCRLDEGNCTWRGRINEMLQHFPQSHSKEKIMSKNTIFMCGNFMDIDFYVRAISAYKELFWFFHMKNDNCSYWAVQYLGPDVNCNKYYYDLKIHHHDDSNKYIDFKKNECFQYDDNWQTIKNNILGSFAAIKMDILKNYLNSSNNKIKISFKLKKY